MKNIRFYDAPKYKNDEYTKVGDMIYKTIVYEEESEDSLSLKGIMDEILIEKLSQETGWADGDRAIEDGIQYLCLDGIKYYRDKPDEDDEDSEIWYYTSVNVDPEEIFVTSIVFEQEPELGENEPSDSEISEYPLEDVLDEYMCYALDCYEEENEADQCCSYIEIAADRKKDLEEFLQILGKHVYNVEDDDIVRLVVE